MSLWYMALDSKNLGGMAERTYLEIGMKHEVSYISLISCQTLGLEAFDLIWYLRPSGIS